MNRLRGRPVQNGGSGANFARESGFNQYTIKVENEAGVKRRRRTRSAPRCSCIGGPVSGATLDISVAAEWRSHHGRECRHRRTTRPPKTRQVDPVRGDGEKRHRRDGRRQRRRAGLVDGRAIGAVAVGRAEALSVEAHRRANGGRGNGDVRHEKHAGMFQWLLNGKAIDRRRSQNKDIQTRQQRMKAMRSSARLVETTNKLAVMSSSSQAVVAEEGGNAPRSARVRKRRYPWPPSKTSFPRASCSPGRARGRSSSCFQRSRRLDLQGTPRPLRRCRIRRTRAPSAASLNVL